MSSNVPSVPLDCIDAIRVIEGDINEAMASVSESYGAKKVSMSNIADFFFSHCGMPTYAWNFCNSLFVRYFTKVAPNLYVGKEFSIHSACFIASICLSDTPDLTRITVEAYADGDDGLSMTLGRCRLMIQNILDVKGGDCNRLVEEISIRFKDYVKAHPTAVITVNIPDECISVAASSSDSKPIIKYSDEQNLVPISAVVSFFAKKHRFVFWPLLMFQAQLQLVFMGEDFWRNLKTVSFLLYLKNKGVTADTYWFTEVLQKMFNTSISKMTSLGTLGRPFERKPGGPKVSLIRHSKHKHKEESSTSNSSNRNSKASVISPLQIKRNLSQSSLPISRDNSFDSSDSQNSSPKSTQIRKRSSKSAAKLNKAIDLSSEINSTSDSESYQNNCPVENSPLDENSKRHIIDKFSENKNMDDCRSQESSKSVPVNLPPVVNIGASGSSVNNYNIQSQKLAKLPSNSLEPVQSVFASTTVNTIIHTSLAKLTSQDDSNRYKSNVSSLEEGNRKARLSLSALDNRPSSPRERDSFFNKSSDKLQQLPSLNDVSSNSYKQSETVQSPRRLKRLESYEKKKKEEK